MFALTDWSKQQIPTSTIIQVYPFWACFSFPSFSMSFGANVASDHRGRWQLEVIKEVLDSKKQIILMIAAWF